MAQATFEPSSARHWKRVVAWLLIVLDLFIVGGVIFLGFNSVIPTAATAPSFHLLEDVPLPSAAVPPRGHTAPAAVLFDRFDEEALLPQAAFCSSPIQDQARTKPL